MDHPGNVRVKWLHSADDPRLALVVANPFELFADYQPEVPEEIVGMLGARGGPEDMLVLTVLSVHRGATRRRLRPISLPPIVICHGTMRGVQVMMKAGKYGVRHEVELLQKNFKAGPKSSAG